MACTYRRFLTIILCLVLSSFANLTGWAADGQPPTLVGFGKVEVTPTEPVRLSGYSTRDKPHTAVADPLFARAMVLTQVKDQASVSAITPTTTGTRTLVMVSVDSIAIVGSMTRQLEEKLQAAYGLARSDFVICSTHSHAAPQAAGGLNNIFRTPLSQEEQAAIDRHAAHVQAGILKAISQAMAARREATLELGESTAAFAVNRRVLKNGLWTGFGKQADGPVDHRVQLIRGISKDGKLLGAAFMYACHCTTLGPDFNQVSADWAGLSASALEKTHSDAVFLPIIGCGADANPEPRTGYEDAKRHGAAMASSIEAALKGQWHALKQFPDGHFGYAGLAPEMPTRAELEAAKNDPSVTRRRWAESMLATLKKMGRLPETYPAPIHTWSFGKDLLWVFLGGEVVLDYQIRLEKNLPADRVWVAAYTDDVFAYVASERMRAEGGYEVDASMLYYNQPGRWQSGTEELIERRVREIFGQERADDKPTTPAQALQSIHVPPGFVVDMMAAEPLVNDPINIAFGHDGRVWVAEMSDYPLGTAEGGRVRWLRDSDGDGTLDQSQIFLSGLNYPSSVIPWRDGAIIITSPAIFFAADRDGDGQAEVREELLQGIAEANPQHRASGFEIGLDGWLNFTSGDNTQELHSTRNGQRTNVSGRDVHWQPDTGVFTLTSGHTQYVRARDEFNNWFGNVNNQPMFHYVVEDPYRRRAGLSGSAYQHLLDPPVAPPVLPASRTKDRFNDLHAFNRFTSACSSIICRVPGLGEEMRGAALVCEPVHNLVARFQVHQAGSSFVGQRFAQDTQFDFFASSDPFSRPVRVVNAPDGTLWIVDMVRLVIEHPQWIPTAWQDQLNLRAGTGLGRIYRVRREDFKPTALPLTDKMSDEELIKTLASDNGAARDLAAQQILWRSTANASPAMVKQLKALLTESPLPSVRAQVLGTLQGLSQVDQATLAIGLKDADPRVRRYAVTLAEPALAEASPDKPGSDLSALANLAGQERDAGVLLQLALSLGGAANPAAHGLLESVAQQASSDTWLAKSLSLVNDGGVDATLAGVLKAIQAAKSSGDTSRVEPATLAALEQTISNLWSRTSSETQLTNLKQYFSDQAAQKPGSLTDLQILLLTAVASSDLSKLTSDADMQQRIASAVKSARSRLFSEDASPAERRRLIPLLALVPATATEVLTDIAKLIGPQEPTEIQQAALNVARKLQAPETPEVLLSKWSELLPDVRASLCTMLLERRPWGEQFVTALEKGTVKVNDLDAALIERLRSYGDRNLIARSVRVLGQPPSNDRARIVKEMLAAISNAGDRGRGEKLFMEHCAVCHRAAPNKPIVGAPLENISNWSPEQWVVAILDPSRAIEPKYHQYSLLTKDGQTLAGLIEDRSSHSLTLAAADGKRYDIELSNIEALKDLGVSLMPEGLETKLNVAAISDLLAYLQTLNARK